MTSEERSDLAAEHALFLLEGADLAQALRLMEGDAAFAAEVDAFRNAAANLVETIPAVQPRAELRSRVLAFSSPVQSVARPSIFRHFGWAAAALLALSSTWLWQQGATFERDLTAARSKLESISTENRLANLQIASLEGQIDQYKGSRAVVIWDAEKHEGQIHITNLPDAGEGKDYQLWIVDPAYKNPVDAGLITRAPDGTANIKFAPNQVIREASAFAVSIEKTGGVNVAQGPIVFLGK